MKFDQHYKLTIRKFNSTAQCSSSVFLFRCFFVNVFIVVGGTKHEIRVISIRNIPSWRGKFAMQRWTRIIALHATTVCSTHCVQEYGPCTPTHTHTHNTNIRMFLAKRLSEEQKRTLLKQETNKIVCTKGSRQQQRQLKHIEWEKEKHKKKRNKQIEET